MSEFANSTRSKSLRHLSKKLYDQRNIKMWINQLINLQCKARCLPLPFVLMTVECLQTGNPCEHRVWWGGVGETIFWIWTAIPFQQLAVNIAYCTFNILCCNHPFSSDGPSGKPVAGVRLIIMFTHTKEAMFWKHHRNSVYTGIGESILTTNKLHTSPSTLEKMLSTF